MATSKTLTRLLKFATVSDQVLGTESEKPINSNIQQNHPSAAKAYITVNPNNFNTIRDEYNISSVADAVAGKVTLNWDVDFSDTNYCVVGIQSQNVLGWGGIESITASSCVLLCYANNGALFDAVVAAVAFGEQ